MKYELAKKDQELIVTLYGALSERSADALAALDGELTKKQITFDLAGVTRVNTAGEALWARFLAAVGRRADYGFRNCSVDFIEAVNKNPELVKGGRVASFHAPLKCPKCAHAMSVVLDSARLSPRASFGSPPCGKCGRAMEAEVPPAAYFGFLYGD